MTTLKNSINAGRAHGPVICAIAFTFLIAGCSNQNDRGKGKTAGATASRSRAVFYFDGSGGGDSLINWADRFEKGLREIGFDGEFVNVDWQTGWGVLADHESQQSYKRAEARKAASAIEAYRQRNPYSPITVVGLSAGTAVAIYALEELPSNVRVDRVGLLSPSIASAYDLSEALQHVRVSAIATMSEKDDVLDLATPLLKTTDDRSVRAAGVHGFERPSNRSTQYGKLQTIEWNPGLEPLGWDGSHTGVTDEAFVRSYLGPRLLGR